MSRKIIACATVRAPNRSLAGAVQVGKVYRPGQEVPEDLTDEVRMQQLFDAGVLRWEGQEAMKEEEQTPVQLGDENGPGLSMKTVDDSGVDAQLNAIKADQDERRARGEKVGRELDQERQAQEAIDDAEEAKRTVKVDLESGEVEDSGEAEGDFDEMRVSN